jgi:hypothetical protein
MKLHEIDVYGKLLKKYDHATREQQEEIRKRTKNAIENFQNVYEQMVRNMK